MNICRRVRYVGRWNRGRSSASQGQPPLVYWMAQNFAVVLWMKVSPGVKSAKGWIEFRRANPTISIISLLWCRSSIRCINLKYRLRKALYSASYRWRPPLIVSGHRISSQISFHHIEDNEMSRTWNVSRLDVEDNEASLAYFPFCIFHDTVQQYLRPRVPVHKRIDVTSLRSEMLINIPCYCFYSIECILYTLHIYGSLVLLVF